MRRMTNSYVSSFGSKPTMGRVDSDYHITRRAPEAMSFNLKFLIATFLVAFGVVHIIAGTMMPRSSGDQPIEATTLGHHGD